MTIQVNTPGGAQLNFPDDTDPAMMQAMVANYAATEPAANPATAQQSPNLFERFGAGVNDAVTGAKQLYSMATGDQQGAQDVTNKYNADNAVYAKGIQIGQQQEGTPMWRQLSEAAKNIPGIGPLLNLPNAATTFQSDAPRAAGFTAALAPTMLIPGGPLVAGTAQGAIGGALMPTNQASWVQKGLNTLEGAGLGVAGGVAAKAVTPGAVRAAPSSGAPIADAFDAMRQNPQTTPYANAEAARQAVAAYSADAKNVAAGTYDAAKTAPGADAAFPAGPFFDKANQVLAWGGSQLPSEVTTRLQQLQAGHILSQGGALPPGVAIENAQPFTVGAASDLYQLINQAVGKSNATAAAAGGQLKSALADVGSALPGEAGTASQLFKDATTQWRTRAQTLAPTPIKTLANTPEANPQFFQNLWRTGKPGEISSLSSLLSDNNPAAAAGMHDSLLDYLQSSAEQGGQAYRTTVRAIGPDRMNAVLSPGEVAQVNNVQTALGSSGGLSSAIAKQVGHVGNTGLGILGEMVGEHLGFPGAGAVVGTGAGMASQKFAEMMAMRRMQNILNPPMPAPQPSMQAYMLQRSIAPAAVGGLLAPPGLLGRPE